MQALCEIIAPLPRFKNQVAKVEPLSGCFTGVLHAFFLVRGLLKRVYRSHEGFTRIRTLDTEA